MKNTKITSALIGLMSVVLLSLPQFAQAAYSPVALSIVPPVQFPPSDYSITGLRLSLFGSHRDMYGLDLGVIGNSTDQSFVGIGFSGLFNLNHGQTTITGLQAAGVTNLNMEKTDVYGLQIAMVANYQKAASSVTGFQVAAANIAAFSTIYGVQMGIYNRANTVYGLQLGVVNVANNLHGVQIGLLNFHYTGLFYVAPILNIGF